MADDINPRQFSSLDNSGLSGSLTNRPASGIPATQPIDYAVHFDVERQIADYQKQNGTYVQKSSPAELALQQEAQAATDAAWRQSVQQSKAEQELQAQAQQAQRTELLNRLKGEQGTPNPFADESDRNRIRRMNNLPPIDEPTPSSIPDRQPAPSTGSPPPTPNGTAARASPLVEPTATPAPAALAEPARPGGGFAGLPRSLPEPAGRFAVPGAFAAADFGIRVYQGQPVTQAASGAVAGAVGAFGGAALGAAVAGPVGAVVGGMVGGYIAGAISDSFFHSPPSTGSPPAEVPNYPPFLGGQGTGTLYDITVTYDLVSEGYFFNKTFTDTCSGYGPIGQPFIAETSQGHGVTIPCYDSLGNPITTGVYRGGPPGTIAKNLRNVVVKRHDGYLDSVPSIQQHAPPPDNAPYYFAGTFGDHGIPSGSPAAGKNKGKNSDASPGIPPNNTPNGNGFFPGHGGPNPSSTPNPSHLPSNLGGNLPSTAPAPAPPPFAEPKDAPFPQNSPAPGGSSPSPDPKISRIENGVVTSPPIDVAQPIPIGFSLTSVPSSSPASKKQSPTPDGVSPTPKAQTFPGPKTPEQTTTDQTNQAIQQQNKDFADQVARLTTMAAVLAGLTPTIQGIPDAIANSPVVQAANKATTQGAVCEIAQPGGCLGDALDNNADKINQNNNQNTASLLDKINAGANAAQLALLNIINNKLGEQLVGGISGFLTTFFEGFNKLTEWLHLDRALNLLTFVMTVQNVYFLCDSMKVVTLQMISDMLAVIGIKDKDNNPLNLNEILGSEVESLLKSILGEQELSGFKKEWKALNRIYQAATNTLFAIQNMVFSVLQALEIIGSWNASIGNALKKYLVVGQKAFEWMNPNPNFHNNFFKFMGNALNVVTSLDFVAQSILQGRQAIDDFGKQTDELSKGIADASDGFKPPENKATAEAAAKSASSSKSPIPSPEDVKTIQD